MGRGPESVSSSPSLELAKEHFDATAVYGHNRGSHAICVIGAKSRRTARTQREARKNLKWEAQPSRRLDSHLSGFSLAMSAASLCDSSDTAHCASRITVRAYQLCQGCASRRCVTAA